MRTTKTIVTDPEYLSIETAAARLDVEPKTVRRYIATGRLSAWRVGPRLIRVSAREVDDLFVPIPTASSR